MAISISGNCGLAYAIVYWIGGPVAGVYTKGTATADGTGAYTTGLVLGLGVYAITPYAPGYTFSPTSSSQTITASIPSPLIVSAFQGTTFTATTSITDAGTLTVSGSSTINALSVGTTTTPTIPFSVFGAGTTTVTFGDASSTKPFCGRAADFPAGNAWTYFYFSAGSLVTTTTIPAGCTF